MGFAVPRSNRQTSGVGDYELTDTARNIGSLLRFGTIHSVNYEARLCRVQLNNNVVTDEIPWITITAGGSVFWNAPSVEETVLLLSPSGELNNSVCLPALQRNPSGTWPFKFSDLEFE
jgi:phage baseplate assembly protein V